MTDMHNHIKVIPDGDHAACGVSTKQWVYYKLSYYLEWGEDNSSHFICQECIKALEKHYQLEILAAI